MAVRKAITAEETGTIESLLTAIRQRTPKAGRTKYPYAVIASPNINLLPAGVSIGRKSEEELADPALRDAILNFILPPINAIVRTSPRAAYFNPASKVRQLCELVQQYFGPVTNVTVSATAYPPPKGKSSLFSADATLEDINAEWVELAEKSPKYAERIRNVFTTPVGVDFGQSWKGNPSENPLPNFEQVKELQGLLTEADSAAIMRERGRVLEMMCAAYALIQASVPPQNVKPWTGYTTEFKLLHRAKAGPLLVPRVSASITEEVNGVATNLKGKCCSLEFSLDGILPSEHFARAEEDFLRKAEAVSKSIFGLSMLGRAYKVRYEAIP